MLAPRKVIQTSVKALHHGDIGKAVQKFVPVQWWSTVREKEWELRGASIEAKHRGVKTPTCVILA